GTIGRRLAQILGADGYDVIILSRSPDTCCPNLPSGVRAIAWDAETPNGWSHLLDHPDTAIVNLAGESIANWRWTESHKQRVLHSRLKTTRAIIQAIHAAEHKPNVLLQASAVGYYGNGGEELLTEHSPADDEWRAKVCLEWEQAAADAGIRTVFLRIGIVLSQRGGALPAFLRAADMMGSRLGHGRQWIPWIHNDDVAHSIRYLMNHNEAEGPFNIVAPHPLRNGEFMGVVADVRGRPALIPVPAFSLYLTLGEQALFVLDSQRASAQKLLNAGYTFHHAEAESALRDLLSHAKHWGTSA
ncbi:MAG: TIGR01777 family oxidoreductase, partial [Chloroflexota bacterium]